jgi:hypothetical protein
MDNASEHTLRRRKNRISKMVDKVFIGFMLFSLYIFLMVIIIVCILMKRIYLLCKI